MPSVSRPVAYRTAVGGRPACAQPLGGLFSRLDAVVPLLTLRHGPCPEGGAEAGWLTGAQILASRELLDALVAARAEELRQAYGTQPRRDVAATEVLHQYAFVACLAMSGPWFMENRVPWLAPGGLAYHAGSGTLALNPDRVSVLTSDPAGPGPGIREVAGDDALRAELRAAVAAHLEPVLAAFAPLLRRRPRSLWGLATDELAEGIWYLGGRLGETARAAEAANALLPGGTAPYRGAAGFRPDAAVGGGGAARTRVGCCLVYTLRPEDVCGGCPRLR